MFCSQKYIAAGSLFFLSVFLSFSAAAYGAADLKNEAVLKNQSRDNFGISDKAKTGSSADKKDRFVPGEVIVKFKAGEIGLSGRTGLSEVKNFAVVKNLSFKENAEKTNIAVFKINGSRSVEAAVQELEKDPAVEYAQPNFIYYPSEIDSNDIYKNLLWGLDNTGQAVNGATGTADADIDAPEAWAINEGVNTSTIVAVIDSGVAYNHPDLAASMWDGTNCKDEKGSPLAGGCNHGYDYSAGDNDPLPIEESHGTHVAGTIAAAKNNGQGVIGVAPHAKIMAVKAGEWALSTAAIIKGIAFAEQNGAKIINASWGGSASSCAVAYDEALYQAIQGFSGLFVTSAGNDAANHDGSSYFGIPADYGQTTSCWAGLDNVVSVAAINADDGLASFSDYGSDFIDAAAPGVDIYSTVASSMPLNENFEGIAVPNIPAGWAREGSGNNWRTASVSSSNVLYGDLSFPYADNAASSVISPVYDLSSTTEATIEFSASCDTEYDPVYWTDYLSLLLSSDGVNFNEEYKLDEFWIDLLNDEDPSSSSSAASINFLYALPSEYLTSNFKAGFGWTSDGDDNNHDGCRIDDLRIVKMSDPADGTGAGYDYMSGTSMAAPHVAGLAALVWGYNPNWTSAQVKNAVINTGDSLGSLSGKITTGKRINAYSALNAFNPVIGYDSGNVIPTSSIAHTGSLGGRYVSFKVKDGAAGRPVSLSDFGYSLDGGANWKTPANGDDSAAFSGNWRTNDAVSEEAYLAGLDYSGRAYSFSFNTQHADFSDFNDADTDNVMIRFKASDEARTSGYVLSGPFSIDNIPPAALVITQPAAATRINADNYSIIGTEEPEAIIAITKNGLPVSSTTIPATTSDFSITVPLEQNSTNVFGVTATDSGGNSLSIVYLPAIIEDSGKAALSLLSVGGDLAAPYYTASSTPEIIFSATDILPDLVCHRDAVDAGYSAMPAENEFSVSAAASSSSFVLPDQGEDGSKEVYISCIDLAGNENSADDNLDADFVLDTVAPTAVLSSLPSSGTAVKTADIVVGGEGVSFYKYKLDSGSYSSSLGIASHISLSGLSVGSHILSVAGGDEAGNWQAAASSTDYDWTIISGSSGSYSGGGGGGGASDVTAPAISNVVATPTGQTTAAIAWQTNESSLSWVLFGTSTVYGQQVKTASYAANHSVALTGLTAGTVYHYQVKSQDYSGNAGAAPDKTFTTLAAGQAASSTAAVATTTASTTSVSLVALQKPLDQMTRAELISFILQIIISLQLKNQTAAVSVSSTAAGQTNAAGLAGIPADFVFKTNLKLGDNSSDVKYLQIVLNSDADTRIVSKGFGSLGYETIHFGPATLAAVKKFQLKYRSELLDPFKLKNPIGEVGDTTRSKLNTLLGK